MVASSAISLAFCLVSVERHSSILGMVATSLYSNRGHFGHDVDVYSSVATSGTAKTTIAAYTVK